MTVPAKFHIDLADKVAKLPQEGVPTVSVVETMEGWTLCLAYTADSYARRAHSDLQALAVIAGWAVSASWMPYCPDPEVIRVCLRFAPPAQAAHAPKPVKPRK